VYVRISLAIASCCQQTDEVCHLDYGEGHEFSYSVVRLVGIRDRARMALKEGQVQAGLDENGMCKRRLLSNLNDACSEQLSLTAVA
jgi:hypothetical protein